MFSTSSIKDLTYQEVLRRVSEYDIFRHYIPIPFRVGEAILSPLRTEKDPSFVIFNASYGSYRLRWYDYSTAKGGSCFDLISELFKCDFMTALKYVDRDLGLGIEDCRVQLPSLQPSITLLEPIREYIPSKIEVGIRKWNNAQDKYDVYPLSHFRINGRCCECRSITYGYYFGNEKWKIYSPYGIIKWLSNTSRCDIQGYNQLKQTGDLLVITKSLKDVILLDSYGISSVAPQSESSMIVDESIKELKLRFNVILVNYDFDYIGVKIGNKYRKEYGLRTLYLTNGRFGTINYEAKDLTDYRKLKGSVEFTELLKKVKI